MDDCGELDDNLCMLLTRGVRAIIYSEPSDDDRFQLGTLKKSSGRDKIQARALYKEYIEFYPQYHIIIQMNNPTSMNGFDAGFVRRL